MVLYLHGRPSVYCTACQRNPMKLYSEKEIGAILKRAAELSMSEVGSNAGGLSLEELQLIGREAGLDPDLILKAASEL